MPYELRLPLPSHERTFAARTSTEWEKAWNESRQLTEYQYPIIYLSFLKRDPVQGRMEFSVMGSFIILHGTTNDSLLKRRRLANASG